MSDNLIRAAERAGLYIESHSGSVTQRPLELYCTACQKTLMQVPAGDMIFTQTHGSCTCSWGCCETAQPSNRPHARHLKHRDPAK